MNVSETGNTITLADLLAMLLAGNRLFALSYCSGPEEVFYITNGAAVQEYFALGTVLAYPLLDASNQPIPGACVVCLQDEDALYAATQNLPSGVGCSVEGDLLVGPPNLPALIDAALVS